MNDYIKITNYFPYDGDYSEFSQVETTIELFKDKEIIKYKFTNEENYPKIIEKIVENYIKPPLEEINKIDISSLKDNYNLDDYKKEWSIEINNKKIEGSYKLLPEEIFKIMKMIDFNNKIIMNEEE